MKQHTQQTSFEAYQEIQPHLGELQATVLLYINANPDHTDKELAAITGKTDPADIRRRRGELVTRGLVECSGRRICTVSGKTAMTWRVR